MLTITNSLSGKKEIFKPLHGNTVKLYVCGITPYDYPHIGHARVYIIFDLLNRLLKFLKYDVTYVRNFTDIDDKLMIKAEKEFGDQQKYLEIANRYIAAFGDDMKALNCLPPNHEPRVTQTIPEIIQFIEGLIAKGKAYSVDGDVYYRISSFPEYGKLSKQKLDELRAGARVEVNDKKLDPLDFALWKSEKPGTFWQSPWGYGRPGWHIECSAMAQRYLGPQIDIHGGGMDLQFPHHENEIAQTEGLTEKPFSKYWMHNAFVRINKEKMSKSLGNFFTINDVMKEFDPMVIRYLILTHYYRAPLDFSWDDLHMLQKSYKKLCTFFAGITCTQTYTSEQLQGNPIIQEMVKFLCDDLNTPGMFGILFDSLKPLAADQQAACQVKQFIHDVLGLTLQPLPEKTVAITPEIQKLLDEREAARAAKDWKRADQLRDQLTEMGVNLMDKKL